jgi:hypothetical protein
MQIIIQGMHRSGTSVLTDLIEKMGAFVGEGADKMPAQVDNPKGFLNVKT